MLKIAFVGYGNSVRNYHLPYLNGLDNIVVKKIFRREEDRINDYHIESYYPEITFTSSWEEIAEDTDIELVVVCSHVDSHADYARQVLECGKHVLVEKPFTSTSQEALDIFSLAKEKGLIVMANQNRRYDGDYLTLKKVIKSGKIGNIVELQSHYNYFNPDAVKPRFDLLYGLAVHTIDQVYDLLGHPDKVIYDVRSFYFPGKADDFIDIDFYYGNSKVTVKCSLFVKTPFPKFTLHGDKGSFIKYSSGHQHKEPNGPTTISYEREPESNWGSLNYIDENGIEQHEHVQSEVTDYGLLYQGLYQAIKHQQPKPIPDSDVLAVLRVLEGGIAAAKLQGKG